MPTAGAALPLLLFGNVQHSSVFSCPEFRRPSLVFMAAHALHAPQNNRMQLGAQFVSLCLLRPYIWPLEAYMDLMLNTCGKQEGNLATLPRYHADAFKFNSCYSIAANSLS
jgi:hypothetical protein